MTTPRSLTRRSFLSRAASAAMLATASKPSLRAQAPGQTSRAPNGRIHLGLIGCGGMGRANMNACVQDPGVVVTAACDVWPARRESVAAQFKDSCRTYADYREMLQQAELDAVIIATPPHWHALQAIAACEAGKDIYLQKPMTLFPGESLAVRNAVRQHERISQIGTQIHAGENYRRVVELIRSGQLGKVGVARTFNVMNQGPEGVGRATDRRMPAGLDWDLWCGPAPKTSFNPILVRDAYYHSSWMDYSGGWTPGMAPHIIDLPIWALDLDYPTSISSSGGRFVVEDDGDAYDHHEVLWRYPNLTLTWMSSLTNSYDFTMRGQVEPARRLGILFHGSRGTLYSNYDMHRVMPEGSRMDGWAAPEKSLSSSPGHEQEWLNSIRSRVQPSCSVLYHVKVDIPITLSLLSLRLGRSIRFDPDHEIILDDPEAARLCVPEYRDPWEFPARYLA
jgi:predicted dehydrogenase